MNNRRYALLLAVATFLAIAERANAQASNVCREVLLLAQHARSNFQAIIGPPRRAPDSWQSTYQLPGASECSIRQTRRGTMLFSCVWRVASRSEVEQMALELAQSARSCLQSRGALVDYAVTRESRGEIEYDIEARDFEIGVAARPLDGEVAFSLNLIR